MASIWTSKPTCRPQGLCQLLQLQPKKPRHMEEALLAVFRCFRTLVSTASSSFTPETCLMPVLVGDESTHLKKYELNCIISSSKGWKSFFLQPPPRFFDASVVFECLPGGWSSFQRLHFPGGSRDIFMEAKKRMIDLEIVLGTKCFTPFLGW